MVPPTKSPQVTLVGGGMITADLLLPSLYHLQRIGVIQSIEICTLNVPPLKALHESRDLQEAFHGQETMKKCGCHVGLNS